MFFVIITFFFVSCKQKSPIWDRQPANTTYAKGFPLDKFHQLGEANDTTAQKTLVNQYRKQLTKNIMSHFPCVTNEKNVRFIFGSGKVKDVISGDGKTYGGKFKNELIIIVNDPCAKDTLFLACGNGMLSPVRWKNFSDWGYAEKCRFVVGEGQSLAYFLPKLQDWGVKAEELGLPITNEKGKIVDSKIYMNYFGKWWSSRIFPGDVIDLCDKKITNKAGQKVDFDRRLLESKKVNKKILEQKINEVKNKIKNTSAIKAKGKATKKEKESKLKLLKAELKKLQSQK